MGHGQQLRTPAYSISEATILQSSLQNQVPAVWHGTTFYLYLYMSHSRRALLKISRRAGDFRRFKVDCHSWGYLA